MNASLQCIRAIPELRREIIQLGGGGRERGREGEGEGGRERGREGEREGGREGEREGGRGRKGG